MGSWRWSRGTRSCALGVQLALVVGLSSGCASGDLSTRRAPRDLLTDVADDGSLAHGLVHPDPNVRCLTLRAFANLPAGDKVVLLHERAGGESDPAVLTELCFALGRWRDPQSGPVLAELARNSAPSVRAAALTALGRLGDDRALPLVTAALADPAADVRGAAALAIFRLDGVRFERVHLATDEQLAAADAALVRVARRDLDVGVRWRAIYTLGAIRPRPGRPAVFVAALADPDPLVRTFALRGLTAAGPGADLDTARLARALLADDDARVAVEAARVVVETGTLDDVFEVLGSQRTAHGRVLAARELRVRLVDSDGMPAERRSQTAMTLAALIRDDPSRVVRREATAALAVLERRGSGPVPGASPWADEAGPSVGVTTDAFVALALSADDRDRELAASLLAEGDVQDDALLVQLLEDPVPAVQAAALGALDERRPSLWRHLEIALASDDVALAGAAAKAAAPLVRSGRATPRLVNAVAESLETHVGYEMAEARVAMIDALGLPDISTTDPPTVAEGTLLDRLLADNDSARADPHPQVLLETNRGEILLELDRLAAPRHVASFLELVDDGFYDGLDIHRVVPNFVVQGLDPRGDGWGTGGRRLPDEFNPAPYLTGTLGMPRTDAPHTGGCQIFMTHVPAPHLDGDYTAFGRVVEGQDVLLELEIGDVITRARRVDD